jgi:protein-disulfide isomerase
MRKDIDELKANQQQILEQLKELKGDAPLKRVLPTKTEQPFDIAVNEHSPAVKGNKNARVEIIEFSDFQCTFCLGYVSETFPQIEKNYLKTGKVKYLFRDLPLPLHANAFRAAEAARCAGEQGKFWEAHDRFFANQNTLNPNDWPQHAQALGLDTAKFNQCLMSGKYDDEIHRDVDEALSLGIEGTPAFLIGVTDPNNPRQVNVRKVLLGAESYDTFKTTLDELLAAKAK